MYFDQVRTVVTIDSDTSLTVDVPFLSSETDLTAQVQPSSIRVDGGDGTPCFAVNDAGSVGIGTAAPGA